MLFTQLTDSKMHGFEVYMGLRYTKVSVFKFYLCNKHCMESTYFCANFLEDFFLFLCFCFLMMGGGIRFHSENFTLLQNMFLFGRISLDFVQSTLQLEL